MDGMSSLSDRERPEDPQTSRVKIAGAALVDTAAVMANTGVAREMTSTQRTNTLIFFIE